MARAAGDLVAAAGAEAGDLEYDSSWNVAPTCDVPIVLERLIDGVVRRQIHVARWGLVPRWSNPGAGAPLFNARSETVLEKPSFRESVRARRCAVPADGYYEWKKRSAKARQPYYVQRADGAPTFFAGLYEWWKDPALPNGHPRQWLLSASIITTEAPAEDSASAVLRELSGLHDRLPVPLSASAMGDWMDPRNGDAASLVELIRAQAHEVAAEWTLGPVGDAVGNVRNNGPGLIEPESALF